MEKPRNIVIAVNLLWFSLAIGIVTSLATSVPSVSSHANSAIIYFLGALTFAIWALVNFKISTGKNWARMIFAFIFLSTIPIFFLWFSSPIQQYLSLSQRDIVIAVIQTVVQGCALFLLFTQSGNAWFRQGKMESPMKRIGAAVAWCIALFCCSVFFAMAGFFLINNLAQFYYSEGYYLANKGHYKEAIEKYSSAINKDPKYGNAYVGRGDAYEQIKETEKAVDDYSKAIELVRPPDPEIYTNRGDAYCDLKQYQKALDDYAKAIQLDPQNARAYNNRADIYNSLKEYKKALEDASQCITFDPDMAEGWDTLGDAQNALHLFDKALTSYSHAIKLDPDHAGCYYHRALVYEKLGKHTLATEDQDKAKKLDHSMGLPTQ